MGVWSSRSQQHLQAPPPSTGASPPLPSTIIAASSRLLPVLTLTPLPLLCRAARAQRLGQKLPSHQLQNLPYRTRPVPVSPICRDPNPPERRQVGSLTLAGKPAHSDPGCWHMDFKLARPHLTASPWPTSTSGPGVWNPSSLCPFTPTRFASKLPVPQLVCPPEAAMGIFQGCSEGPGTLTLSLSLFSL